MEPIRITIETNASDASKTFEQLSNAFTDADNSAKDLRKEIRDLKSNIYKMTPGTEEYAKALVDLGAKMNTLGDIQRDLKASSGGLDTVFQTTTTAIGTMASGFQAAAGVVTLFGGDAENLQQTFIQLQSVMAIAQGLKGFSGFIKYTESASASLKAFINKLKISTNAVKTDTAQKNKDVVATKTLSGAQKEAAASTGLLATGFKKLTAAIASNPIGAVLVALTALVTIISRMVTANKQAKEAQDSYNKIMGQSIQEWKDVNDMMSDYDRETERHINKLKAAGAEQEKLNEYENKRIENMKKEIEQEAKAINYVNNSVNNLKRQAAARELGYKSVKKMNEALAEMSKKYEEINKRQEDLKDVRSPFTEYNAKMKRELQEMDILIAEGLASTKDKYLKQIELAEEGKRQILAKYSGTHGRLSAIDQATIDTYNQQIQNLTQQIKIIDAGHRKEVRESARKTAETYEKNFEGLSKKISDAVDDFIEESTKTLDKFSNLDIEGVSVAGGIMIKLRQILLDADDPNGDFAEKMKELWDEVDDVYNKGGKDAKISLEQANILWNTINEARKTYETRLNETVTKIMSSTKFNLPSGDTFVIKDIDKIMKPLEKDVAKAVGIVTDFRNIIANLDQEFNNGTITPQQYSEALLRNVGAYREGLEHFLKSVPGAVSKIMTGMVTSGSTTDEQRLAIRSMLEQYLRQAIYIPDAELDAIASDGVEIIESEVEKVFEKIEAEYGLAIMNAEQKFYVLSNNRMTEGGEGFQGFLNRMLGGTMWGIGEGQSYKMAVEQTSDVFNAFKEMTDKEIAELDRQMNAAGADVALREQLNAKKLQLQAEYNSAIEKYYNDLENLEHEHIAGIMSNINVTASAISGMGNALSDYYQSMADDEEENSEKQREYTLKSLNAKKWMTYANIASGVASVIAGAMELGIPMGPIVAAIESASVIASGAAQIKSINKSIRELGGSSSQDTPDAAGMVDRIITANAQNSDQTAQLNAKYTGGAVGEQKVYVTQSDISDAQDLNRTAVTQNGF